MYVLTQESTWNTLEGIHVHVHVLDTYTQIYQEQCGEKCQNEHPPLQTGQDQKQPPSLTVVAHTFEGVLISGSSHHAFAHSSREPPVVPITEHMNIKHECNRRHNITHIHVHCEYAEKKQ